MCQFPENMASNLRFGIYFPSSAPSCPSAFPVTVAHNLKVARKVRSTCTRKPGCDLVAQETRSILKLYGEWQSGADLGVGDFITTEGWELRRAGELKSS